MSEEFENQVLSVENNPENEMKKNPVQETGNSGVESEENREQNGPLEDNPFSFPEESAFPDQPVAVPQPDKKKKISISPVAAILIFAGTCLVTFLIALVIVLFLTRNGVINTKSDGVISDTLSTKLQYIKTLMDYKYIYNKDTDYDDEVIKAYVDSFDDVYAVYYTAEEYESIYSSLTGSFYGIGVTIFHQDDESNVITLIHAGGAAESTGIQVGDEIVGVDGEDVKGMELDLLVTKIRGELGTEVTVRIYRSSDNTYQEYTMKRALVEEQVISYEMLDEDQKIGYIYLSSFTSEAAEQFEKAYKDLEEQGMEGLIFDLRANGGGLYEEAIELLDLFLPECLVSYTEEKDGSQEKKYSSSFYIVKVPTVLLLDGGSASASEVFAGAIQYYDTATLVGSQSYGKGIVQTLYSLGDGSVIKFTTASFYNPGGVCIHGTGITPEVVIDWDGVSDTDNQLDKALEVLLEKMKE